MWWGSTVEVLGLGAALAGHRPQERVRVLFDPAGRPFCLCHGPS